jgi:hypothetical protein
VDNDWGLLMGTTTEETQTPAGESAPPRASTEVGQRIAAILDAAEASAEKIRGDARSEATQIVRQAHERAANRMEELTREPERIRDEAARDADATRASAEAYASETRAAADGYSTETRGAADTYAAETRAAADTDAKQLRQDAESDVRKIEDEGRRRQKELADQTRRLAEVRDEAVGKVREAIGGLRGAADTLEHETLPAVGIEPGAAAPEARGLARLLRRDAAPVVNGNGADPDDATPADDLYAQAKQLGIRGRSKMSRAELEQAVVAASAASEESS